MLLEVTIVLTNFVEWLKNWRRHVIPLNFLREARYPLKILKTVQNMGKKWRKKFTWFSILYFKATRYSFYSVLSYCSNAVAAMDDYRYELIDTFLSICNTEKTRGICYILRWSSNETMKYYISCIALQWMMLKICYTLRNTKFWNFDFFFVMSYIFIT